MFMIEIDRLHEIVIKKENDVENWSKKFKDLERSHDMEIDGLKAHFEDMMKSRIVSGDLDILQHHRKWEYNSFGR